MQYIIGVDLGGTNTKAGLVTREGKIVARAEVPTEAHKGQKVVIKNILDSIEKIKNSKKGKIIGIGIGSPGPLDFKSGKILNPVNLPLKNTPLKNIVEKKFKIKTFLDNDANCYALGEARFGAAKGYKNVLGMTLGTGIGGGIILGGKPYRGRGNAAEIGHMTIDYKGPKSKCGNDGCIEAHAAAKGILSWTRNIDVESTLQLYTLAKKGNKEAKRVFSQIGDFLGIAIANLVYAFDPDIIVLGGKISNAWPFFSKSMNETIRKRYFSKPCEIARTALGRDAGILGAAALVLEK